MQRNIAAATFAATALIALAAVPASAGQTRVEVTCAASDALPPAGPGLVYTTCAGQQQYRFQSDGIPTSYGIKFTAPPTHCSDVNYQVYATYEDRLLGRTRAFLAAGQSEIVPIGNDFARGLQVVNIRALGKVGGCNQGRMHSWAALVELVVIP
ncbi:MAG: hypothetical protein KBA31_07675 [Alphaproteobacteria bacterium]|nr:hypothetical protein [Alphaproteobacteria bacterium]